MAQNNERLALLRSALQKRLQAKAFYEERMAAFEEIFNYLEQSNVAYSLIDLVGIEEEWFPHLTAALLKPPYDVLTNDIGKSKAVALLDQLFILYPSTNPLRYVPAITKIDQTHSSESGLKQAIANLSIKNQPVFVYYLNYAPLLQLQLYDLRSFDSENLFDFWYGDMVIFPDDLSWLIAQTLEEEWYAGRLEYKNK